MEGSYTKGGPMRISRASIVCAVAIFLAMVFAMISQPAVSNAFTEGKTIRLLVFATPGGGYDFYSRLVMRHIPKYLPGNPKTLVQNMPIGYAAANTLWRSKPDGLIWGVLSREGYLGNIAGDRALKYDYSKGVPIGSAANENTLIYIRTDTGISSLKDLAAAIKAGKKPPIMGGTIRSGASYVWGEILEYLAPEMKFKQVLGYPGGSEVDLAIRRGEAQAAGRSKNSFFSRMSDVYKSGEIKVILQTGTVDGKRDPDFENVPTIGEFADSREDKQLLSLALLSQVIARAFWLPPGVPQDKVKLIREAFRRTVNDPKLVAQAKRSRRHIEPVYGDQMAKMYAEAFAAPESVKERIRKILGK